MKPVKFKEANLLLAKDQEQYLTLPTHLSKDSAGVMTTLWGLNFWERVKVFFTGRLYFQVITFRRPVYPQKPSVDKPDLEG